jgi:hypothetical protein
LDEIVREWVKSEALKQFDGDYSVLWMHHLDFSFFDGQSLRTKIIMGLAKYNQQPEVKFSRLMEDYPTLQFSVPVNVEKWDAENDIPLTTYCASDFEDSSVAMIECYRSGDVATTLSTKQDPAVPVVVVGLNERVNPDGRLDPPADVSSPASKTFRNDLESESIWQINVPNISAIEGWVAGKPEFRFRMNLASGDTVRKKLSPQNKPRSEFTPSNWVQYHFEVLATWDWSTMGQHYVMHWWEDDADDNWTWDVDDYLESAMITRHDYCWEDYNTGAGIRWYMECEN